MAAGVAAALLQTRLAISVQSLIPKLNRISPLNGFKRLFSKRAIVEFIKGIIKLFIVSFALFVFYRSKITEIPRFLEIHPKDFLGDLSFYVVCSIFIVVGCMSLVALLDYLYQKYEHTKSLRMTKDEVKREFKNQDGDPLIKNRRRQIAHQRIRKNVKEAMGRATAVITNPTHYAVAISYQDELMDAPVVVLKGTDFVALKMRELATEMEIPLIENPPLARALYASVEVDQEIHPEHYKAVAEVIRFVMTLKKKVF
jgi:flagellar biosynthesis protein FlhB